MPLTSKGSEIEQAMEKEYGAKKGESVFYASKNKGTIAGVDRAPQHPGPRDCDLSEGFRSTPEYSPSLGRK